MLFNSILASYFFQTFFKNKKRFFIITPIFLLLWQISCVNSHRRGGSTLSPINGRENSPRNAKCPYLGNIVDCSDLQLIYPPSDLPSWITILTLKGNKLKNFDFGDIKHLIKLEELDLSSNGIENNFTANSSYFPHLTNLKLNKNLFTRIPDFLGFENLTHLSIAHNHINRINFDLLQHLPNLQSLDLADNHFKILPRDSFLTPNSLTRLNLNSNKISKMEVGCFSNLTQLEDLRLNKNNITHIVKDVFANLKQLRILELNNNQIHQIQGLSFKNLTNLQELRLKKNRIDSLNDGAFYGLKNLKILQLDNNNLTIVKKGGLFGLEHLRKFVLSHNNISKIETQAWEIFKELRELDISNNKLTMIETDTFEYLINLEKLRIDHNKITYISDEAFNHLPNLRILGLNGNKISYMIEDISTGAFISLSHLMKLGLASNQIKSINKNAFEGLTRLKELDLLGNNITNIQENAFKSMPNLSKLKMNTAALVCDCGLQWFSIWLRESKHNDTNVRCGYPHWLKNTLLIQLHRANFTCEEFPKPRIIEGPANQMSIKGENVTLSCRASSTSDTPLHFIWKHENVELRDNYVKQISHPTSLSAIEVTSILHLINITHSDAGKYQCMVSNTFGTSYSSKAKINVLVYPSFSKKPNDIFVLAGSTARLECSAEGHPAPRIAWQKDGGNDFPAARERRMHMMATDPVLFIINVKVADGGTYSCTAQNLAGRIVTHATLKILEKPTFLRPMKNKNTVIGESVVLECITKGEPPPERFWSKNGIPLLLTDRHHLVDNQQFLIIINTQVNDTGNYECHVNNSLGSISGVSQLNIYPHLSVGNDYDELRMIIIAVCCVVITSIIWVIIIYYFRRRIKAPQNLNCPIPIMIDGQTTQLYFDSSSQHSKDSGTGDSTNPSNDQLQFCLPEEVITCSINNEDDVITGEDPLLQYTNHQRSVEIDRKSIS